MKQVLIYAAIILAGCTPVDGQLRGTDGQQVEIAYVFMNPLCLFICNTSLATTGSDVDTIGQGASGSNSQTQTVTAQQQGAGN